MGLVKTSLVIVYLGYSSDNTITVAINNKRYEYYNINPYQCNKVKKLIDVGNYKLALSTLKKYKYRRGEDRKGGIINKAILPHNISSEDNKKIDISEILEIIKINEDRRTE